MFLLVHKSPTLEYMGRYQANKMINVIKALYSSSSAAITFPHATSNGFTTYNGTRQGCPLSPLFLQYALSL